MVKSNEPPAAPPAPELLRSPIDAPAGDDGPWVRIATLHDPVQARALRELLLNAGIPSATPGAEHRSVLGLFGAYISIAVQVPAAQRQEARRIYDAFVLPGLDSRVPSADPEQESDEASGPSRLKRIAIFIALVLPIGAGHLYARDTYAGAVIFLAQAAAVVAVCAGGPPHVVLGALLVLLYDVVGGVRAVERHNTGRARTEVISVVVTVLAVLASHALAVPLASMLETYVPPHGDAAEAVEGEDVFPDRQL